MAEVTWAKLPILGPSHAQRRARIGQPLMGDDNEAQRGVATYLRAHSLPVTEHRPNLGLSGLRRQVVFALPALLCALQAVITGPLLSLFPAQARSWSNLPSF